MNEFLNTVSKQHVEIGTALVALLIIFLIVFALTFVPNPKDAHKPAEKRKQRSQKFEEEVRNLDRHFVVTMHRPIIQSLEEDRDKE